MGHTTRLLFALLAAPCILSPAQQPVREQPPLYSGPMTQVPGIFVTPIPAAPFTATVVVKDEQPAADGSVTTRQCSIEIARDSAGRVRNERHMLVPDSFRGTAPIVFVHTFDPATRISHIYSPATMIDRQNVVPPPPAPAKPEGEDLGYTTLNGLQAKGTKVTRTVPAAFSGTGKAVTITGEIWYSEDLHMNMLEPHTDVRGGVQTVAILSFKRGEPVASLFEPLPGYKTVDMTPPANAPVAQRQ